MLAPLSWLKEYVEITLNPEKLAERLTEVGLATEKITKTGNDFIFEFEITPNRPDLLSIIGIAREIAAIEGKRIKFPSAGVIGRPKKILPLKIKTDFKINPLFTGIIIDGITIKESPDWLKERLIKIGQRPINNIVDITNYVMFELGNPIHAFDYDKIVGHQMVVHQAKGGEEFKSVDSLNYKLPKGAVVISDQEKIIDLCGIKGGFNSGTFEGTKTIFVRVPVEVPVLIRRASQALGLHSEASSIFERGVNAGGTIEALSRCLDLILSTAGGEVASNLYDLKKSDFLPWKLTLRLARLNEILGIVIPKNQVLEILEDLNLSPQIKKIKKQNIIETTIPTYRNDLKIEEDLIEEVARLYGYNKFPKTMPAGEIPTRIVPYFKDYQFQEKVKQILVASGFSEVYTYSLISEKDLLDGKYNPQKSLRVDNPVSREFEYLRPTLLINLLKALKSNLPNFDKIDLFELGKVYIGESLDKTDEFYNSARINEQNLFCEYNLAGITNHKSFFEVKGILERLFKEFGIDSDPTAFIKPLESFIAFEVNFSELEKKVIRKKVYKPIPKYPPIIEDLALVIPRKVPTGNVINEIKKVSSRVKEVNLLDLFEDTRTFHIVYQHPERNLTNEEVSKIRQKILQVLKEKFKAKPKE